MADEAGGILKNAFSAWLPATLGKEFVTELEAKMAELGTGKVASVMGRYYAMDRDKR